MNEKVGELVSIFKRGNAWHANYQTEGRQHRVSLKTKSKKQAIANAQQLERKLIAGDDIAVKKTVSLKEICEAFMNSKRTQGLSIATIDKYDRTIESFQAYAESKRVFNLTQLGPSLLDSYRAIRLKELSKKEGRDGLHTTQDELQLIKSVINFALERKMITHDPLQGYKIRKIKPKPQPFWNQNEIEQILNKSHLLPHRDVFEFLALTGTRIEEVRQLTWLDIDKERNVILIQAKQGWKPKSGDARSIPISELVAAIINRQPKLSRWIFTFTPKGKHTVRQISSRRLLEHLKRVLSQLNLPGHLHTFRHSFISWALNEGTAEAHVREWVGHVDAEILRHYTHIASQESQRAMQRLEATITEGGDTKPV